MYRRDDNLRIAAQGGGKVVRMALLVHHLKLTCLVVDAFHRILQLLIYNDAVGDNNDVAENILVIRVVQGGKDMREPCDGVCLAAARRMLNQLVFREDILATEIEPLRWSG